MAIKATSSMGMYILPRDPEKKYVRALEIIKHDHPGITSQTLLDLFCTYMKTEPSDVFMSNEAREAFLERTFFGLTFPMIPTGSAVSMLRSCDIHLESLVFTSFGYTGHKFSSLVLGQYAQILPSIPGYEPGYSTQANFDKSPAGRLLAIKLVFEQYLRNPSPTFQRSNPSSRVHADYDKVKQQFSLLLRLQGLGELSPERSLTPPTLPFPGPTSLGNEVRALLAGGSSPESRDERRALIQRRFEELITSRSPPREAEAAFQTAPVAESPEKLISPTGSSTPPVETTAPETLVRSPANETTVEVLRDPPRPRVVVSPAVATALQGSQRAVQVTATGNIRCTIANKL